MYNGVDYKDVYNYDYYRTKNADLQKVFGTDSAKYLKHFVEYGMKEGRPASKDLFLKFTRVTTLIFARHMETIMLPTTSITSTTEKQKAEMQRQEKTAAAHHQLSIRA